MRFFVRLHILVALFVVISSSLHAGVRINEFMAAPWDRQMVWNEATGSHQIGTGIQWYSSNYDDADWLSGQAPFGYGLGSVNTDLSDYMDNKLFSTYFRKVITVSSTDATSSSNLELKIDYNDGFVAWINGKEVKRAYMGAPGGSAFFDQNAFDARVTSGTVTYTLGAARDLLKSGDNIIAIQIHNYKSDDASARMEAALSIGSTSLLNNNSTWNYLPGVAEASGVFDASTLPDVVAVIKPASVHSVPNWFEDYFEEWEDWIELYNDGNVAVSLNGWSLTDNLTLPNKWIFPNITIPAKGYLIVFADEKSGTSAATSLHTNFKLNKSGEYLGLYNDTGTLVDEVAVKEYPKQFLNISYSWDGSGFQYTPISTPRAANSTSTILGRVDQPNTNYKGGLYTQNLSVVLTCKTEGASIYYTLDGSEPHAQSSSYSSPIHVSNTTVLRARAFKTNYLDSNIETQTYLLNLNSIRSHLPILSLVGDEGRALYKPHGFLSITAEGTPDEEAYHFPNQRGKSFERRGSMELIYPADNSRVQSDLGMRAAGSTGTRSIMTLQQLSRSPWIPYDVKEKPSMNFFFRDEYEGPLKHDLTGQRIDSFDSLRLRAGRNDAENPFIRDELMRRLFIDMGNVGARGVNLSLFMNGDYKGYFNLTERLRKDFFQDWYKTDAEWDIKQVSDYPAGDGLAMETAFAVYNNEDLDIKANFDAAAEEVDMANIADYFMLNTFALTGDWPNNNYVLARERSPNGKIRAYVWDAEYGFYNNINNNNLTQFTGSAGYFGYPGSHFAALYDDSEFRLLFADRVQKHFFNGGALSYGNIENHIVEMSDEMRAVVLDTLSWIPEYKDQELKDWVTGRQPIYLTQLRAENLWPATAAPEISQMPGVVNPGTQITLSNPNGSGTVYYTTDGSDPRAFGGAIQGSIYSNQQITINKPTPIKARVLKSGEWSPLLDAGFSVNLPLIISEINYNAQGDAQYDGDSYEFIELKNTGSQPLELDGFKFSTGIDFTFNSSHTLAAGGYLVIAKEPGAFSARYPGTAVAGPYAGKLSNDGETITLLDSTGATLLQFKYDNNFPWPASPDNKGFTLVAKNESAVFDPSNPANWRASYALEGSPLSADQPLPFGSVLINEVLAHTDPPLEDTIELFNPGSSTVDISYWFLTDDIDRPHKYQFPANTTLGGGAYLSVVESLFGPHNPAVPTTFSISSLGDTVYLFSANSAGNLTGYMHYAKLTASKNAESWGRTTLSSGEDIFLPEALRTLGSQNAGVRIGPVIINEILYSPISGDVQFVELKNISGQPVNLYDPLNPANTWQLKGLNYAFPQNTTLASDELALVVATEPSIFRTNNNVPASVQIFGPVTGELQDNGEELILYAPDTPDTDALGNPLIPQLWMAGAPYLSTAPWPTGTATSGVSIERTRTDISGVYATAWTASAQRGGAPGVGGSGNVPPTVDIQTDKISGNAPLSVTFDGSASTDPDGTIASYVWDFDNDGATDSSIDVPPAYTYNVAGTYLAQLTVTDNHGAVRSSSVTITVSPAGTIEPVDITYIDAGDHWNYFKGTSDPGSTWMTTNFNDSSWANGPSGFGYGDNDDATDLTDMEDLYTTVFIRKSFQVADASVVTDLQLWVDFDDGYVAYLNGTQIASANAPATLNNTAKATSLHHPVADGGTPDDIAIPSSYLVTGTNVLAIVALNVGISSSDLTMIPTLTAKNQLSATQIDSDGDGLNDFLEEAFNLNPSDPADAPTLSQIYSLDTSGDASYTVRNMNAAYTYVVQTSTDLTTWSDHTTLSSTGGPTIVQISQSLAINGHLFIRLKVSN